METLTGNKYQQLASRTINQALTTYGKRQHALFGMAAEVGELLGLYQKSYQGHELIEEHEQKEIGEQTKENTAGRYSGQTHAAPYSGN